MSSDGRNIDPAIGTLSGEGSQQNSTGDSIPFHRGHTSPVCGDPTYYDRPVIKKSVWSWTVPAYYYVGGAAGASMTLGAAATLLKREAMGDLILRSRLIGAAGGAVSAALLIHDLGKPSRFFNMLRVFRPTSPMNMGSWILVSFSGFATLAALGEFGPVWLGPIADAAGIAAGAAGLALSGYTGVLIAHTTVPIWQRPHRFLPVLFMSSGVTASGSLFEIIGGADNSSQTASIFGIAGKVAELTCAHLMERNLATVPEVARPLQEGFSGFLWKGAKVLMASSLFLSLVTRRSSRLRRLAGVLGTLGSLCTRFGIHYAGQKSAMNPRATFHQHRHGQGAFEITGSAAVTGPQDERAVIARSSKGAG